MIDDAFTMRAGRAPRPASPWTAPLLNAALAVLLCLGGVAAFRPSEATRERTYAFLGTGGAAIAGVIILRARSRRRRRREGALDASRLRFSTALARGRCGLWDWDLARGAIAWSDSMRALLGRSGRGDGLSYGDLKALIHPDDGDLYDVVSTLLEEGESVLDRTFRMRHADGRWIWIRLRAEMTKAEEEPHVHRLRLIGAATDVTEQRRLQNDAAAAQTRLREAVETMPDAYALWDSERRLVLCNGFHRSVFGLPDWAAVPGAPYEAANAAARRPMSNVSPIRPHPQIADARIYEADLDGLRLRVVERDAADGGTLSIATDVSVRKMHVERSAEFERRIALADLEAERARLAAARQAEEIETLTRRCLETSVRAEEANRVKAFFLSHVSHELRTPLNAVINFSEIMESGLFGDLGSAKYKDYCRDIKNSGLRLLEMIEDVLEMARLSAGERTLERERVDLDAAVEDALRIVSARATERGVKVRRWEPSHAVVQGDRRALRRILTHLLSNAVKFAPAGGWAALRARTAGRWALVTIADNGSGAPAAALKRLGQPFEIVETPFAKGRSGLGLGLAISQALVALHGGAMRIRSAQGRGTVVTVRLPRGGVI